MKGPFREIFPTGPFKVEIDLPTGARPTKAKLLVAETDVPLQLSNGTAIVTVPKIAVHEVVALDLG